MSRLSYRAVIRRATERAVVSQFNSGTLLVQGVGGSLFEEVCQLLEGKLTQPFAERGARYVPDTNRDAAVAYLSQPGAEQEAMHWALQQINQDVFEFLPRSEQEGYISGASVLLWLRNGNQQLRDYSTIVMPFARAYEGFVIQLAIRLNITSEKDVRSNLDRIKAGDFLNQIRTRIETTDKIRYSGLADTLQGAWRDIRNKVLHSDPENPPPHNKLSHAENDIATLNRAMSHGYEYLVNRGIIAPKPKSEPNLEYVPLRVNTETLLQALTDGGFTIRNRAGATWIAEKDGIKIVCPIAPSGEIRVTANTLDTFKHQYSAFLLPDPTDARQLPSMGPIHSSTRSQFSTLARIGLDESGKGDYFGPLVVGAVYVDEKTEAALLEMGVRDSKKISDRRILELAETIKQLCPHSVVHMGPKRYNELYDKIGNLNKLLAWGHARALENVLESQTCNLAVADQFGDEAYLSNALLQEGRKITLEQRTKGEQDTAVAAASILARAEFVNQIERLSRQFRAKLPKGSSNPQIVAIAKQISNEGGVPALSQVAKLHFRTTNQILSNR